MAIPRPRSKHGPQGESCPLQELGHCRSPPQSSKPSSHQANAPKVRCCCCSVERNRRAHVERAPVPGRSSPACAEIMRARASRRRGVRRRRTFDGLPVLRMIRRGPRRGGPSRPRAGRLSEHREPAVTAAMVTNAPRTSRCSTAVQPGHDRPRAGLLHSQAVGVHCHVHRALKAPTHSRATVSVTNEFAKASAGTQPRSRGALPGVTLWLPKRPASTRPKTWRARPRPKPPARAKPGGSCRAGVRLDVRDPRCPGAEPDAVDQERIRDGQPGAGREAPVGRDARSRSRVCDGRRHQAAPSARATATSRTAAATPGERRVRGDDQHARGDRDRFDPGGAAAGLGEQAVDGARAASAAGRPGAGRQSPGRKPLDPGRASARPAGR